jgi:hypothetical protein
MCRCKKFLEEFANWSTGHTGSPGTNQTWNVVNFLMTRNFVGNNRKRIVAYGEGILELDPTRKFLHSPPGTPGRPDASPGKMYFSDRFITVGWAAGVRSTPAPGNPCSLQLSTFDPGPGPFFPGNPLYTGPFCGNNTDSFRLQIDIETGETTYFDLTWHFNAVLDLRCANGVLYGFSRETTATPWACVISLTKGTVSKAAPPR